VVPIDADRAAISGTAQVPSGTAPRFRCSKCGSLIRPTASVDEWPPLEAKLKSAMPSLTANGAGGQSSIVALRLAELNRLLTARHGAKSCPDDDAGLR